MSLHGKVALVTGAGRGIGRAICRRLAADGAGIVAVARSEDELGSLAAELGSAGGSCWTLAADLRDPRAAERIIPTAIERAGRLDILVNNAGIAWCRELGSISYEAWRDLLALNLDAVFLLTKAALPVFRGQKSGHIVNIGSDAGIRGIGTMTCYCASKFALRGFTLALREELKGSGIRLSLIQPGPVNTGIISDKPQPNAIQPAHLAELVWQAIAVPQPTAVWEILVEPASW